MKRFFVLAMILTVITLNGCAQNSSTTGSGTPPGIANLSFSPSSVNKGDGGGAILVTAYIDFLDNDGDISTITLQNSIGTYTTPISGIDGIKSGTLYASVITSTTTEATYPFAVWVTDKANNDSNHLTGTFSII